MTADEIDKLGQQAKWWREVGHSSRFPLHLNKLDALLALAKRAAAMSELERAAIKRRRAA